ncbi:MAG: Hpt domain-containing protein, partial [Planctomycetota bacterium]|nr:Hpt domain-containing protein [Planctomycetota bacterium]
MPRKRDREPVTSASPAAEKAEKAAELCVLADPKDLQALAALHSILEEIAAACSDSCPAAQGPARRMAGFLEKVILGDAGDPDAGLSLLRKGIAALQRMICQSRTLAESDMPAEFADAPGDQRADAPGASGSNMTAPSTASFSASPPSPTAPSPSATSLPDMSLLAEFISEAREHFAMAEEKLLALENEPRAEDALNSLFRVFHTIKGVAGFLNLNDIGTVAHEAENLLDKARRKELLLQGPASEAAFAALDTLKRLTAAWEKTLATKTPPAPDPTVPALLERLRAAAVQAPMPALATATAPAEAVAEAAETPAAVPGAAVIKETVKVDAERLDRLLDAIGELVIAESMVSQSAEIRGLRSAMIDRHLSQLDKITRELQEMGMSLRMVPIKATFQKMARLVRDLAKKSGKAVEFVMSGEDTEIDKSVVDRIGDPLVHMVRNAVDHG